MMKYLKGWNRAGSEAVFWDSENRFLKPLLRDGHRLGAMIGKSEAMQRVYRVVGMAASTDAGVVVCGESGTGKELAARTIHLMSRRSSKNFVPVNCGAIPERLLESEFFGYKKGAFTGAHQDKAGFLEYADGGTLFLDEIGELSLNLQVKLLRALEGSGFSPLGSTEVRQPDVRIIAATNRDLAAQVQRGEMREDFFYRINIVPVTLPPLRERKEDIPLLVTHFLKEFGSRETASEMDSRMVDMMHHYGWPGNVRELQNAIHRYLVLGSMELKGAHPVRDEVDASGLMAGSDLRELGFHGLMKAFEKKLLQEALERSHWHRGKTAELLKLPPRTFYKKLKDHRLN